MLAMKRSLKNSGNVIIQRDVLISVPYAADCRRVLYHFRDIAIHLAISPKREFLYLACLGLFNVYVDGYYPIGISLRCINENTRIIVIPHKCHVLAIFDRSDCYVMPSATC